MIIGEIHTDEQGRRYRIAFRMPRPVNYEGPWTAENYHPLDWRAYLDDEETLRLPGWVIPFVIGLVVGMLL